MAGLPEFVHPRRFARRGRSLVGTVPVEAMRRLGGVLSEPQGEAQVALAFESDEDGTPHVRGTLGVAGLVPCQRCLEMMPISVHATVRLRIVEPREPGSTQGSPLGSPLGSAEAAPAQGGPDEDELWEVGDEPVALATLVEDELLLALPDYPMHPPGECPPGAAAGESTSDQGGEDETRDDSPFAVLEALKRGGGVAAGEATRERDHGGTAKQKDTI